MNKEEIQSKAYDKMLKIAKKASLEILVVTDGDVEMAIEMHDKAMAKLTPDVLRKIKRDVVDELCDNFQYAMANAIANHL